jgi:hypothetical protein
VTLVNASAHALGAGALTVAGGGEGTLDGLAPGSTTTTELGLDRTTTIIATPTIVTTPARIVEISQGRIDVEDDITTTITFAVSPPDRVVHGLAPIVLKRQQRRRLNLANRRADVTPYLVDPNLPPAVADQLRAIVAHRREVALAEIKLDEVLAALDASYPRRPAVLARRFDSESARVEQLRAKLVDLLRALPH